MDFEGLGMAMGMRKNMDQIQDVANSQIAQANRTIAILTAKVEEARRQAAQAQAALKVENAYAAGLAEALNVLRGEMVKVNPGHPLLQPTGKRFPNGGKVHTNLTAVYEQGFDKAFDRKFGDPKKFRDVAV